jgi:hypothetical protein
MYKLLLKLVYFVVFFFVNVGRSDILKPNQNYRVLKISGNVFSKLISVAIFRGGARI